MSGKLYLVGTPIGNLGDFSPRAVETLQEADFIAAEDTRVTLKLLNHFGIKKPMVSYFEHNKYASGAKIFERIASGESCALVTDAGMPAISDPGEDIVRMCAENGVEVVTVPGPSALISAIALSALPTGRFCFEGFLSTANKSRREHLESLRPERRTMIFYEAPHKLLRTLEDMKNTFGEDRKISLCRELTKLHEQTLRTTLGGALEYFTCRPRPRASSCWSSTVHPRRKTSLRSVMRSALSSATEPRDSATRPRAKKLPPTPAFRQTNYIHHRLTLKQNTNTPGWRG